MALFGICGTPAGGFRNAAAAARTARSPAPQTAELLSLISRSRRGSLLQTCQIYLHAGLECLMSNLYKPVLELLRLSGGTTELLACQYTLT